MADIELTDVERLDKASDLLKAIAHPLRLQILFILARQGELTVTAIQQHLTVTVEQSLLSHHLISMRKKGLLDMDRRGKNIFYFVPDLIFIESIDAFLKSKTVVAQSEF